MPKQLNCGLAQRAEAGRFILAGSNRDTPPSVEDHLAAINGLCGEAAFFLVPTGYTDDDLGSVIGLSKTRRKASVGNGFARANLGIAENGRPLAAYARPLSSFHRESAAAVI